MDKLNMSQFDFDEMIKAEYFSYENQFYSGQAKRIYNCYFRNDSLYAKDYLSRLKRYKLKNGKTAYDVFLAKELKRYKNFDGIKGLSVASSSRLCFEYLCSEKKPLLKVIDFSNTSNSIITIRSHVELEKLLHIRNPQRKSIARPNIDAFFEDDNGSNVFVECKCHELFQDYDVEFKKTLNQSYSTQKPELVSTLKDIGTVLPIEKNDVLFPYVQFVKHIYGIQDDFSKEDNILLYIFFKPKSDRVNEIYTQLRNQMVKIANLETISQITKKNNIALVYSIVDIDGKMSI
jgi:hypothetical protein